MKLRSVKMLSRVACGVVVLGVALLPASASAAQRSPAATVVNLPGGTTIPVELEHGIKAGTTSPGTVVTAATTQRVLLGDGTYLPRGMKITGTVVRSVAANKMESRPAVLTIRFDALRYQGREIPIRTHAVAVANVMNVEDTFACVNDPADNGTSSPANWTTRQVGGQLVSRARWAGPVLGGGMRKVGFANWHGVFANPPAGATGSAAIPHALGVFSTTAEGLYGYPKTDSLAISSRGGTTITARGKLALRDGSNLLLQVD